MNYVGNPPAPAGTILVGDTNPVGAIAFFHAPPDGSYLRLNGQIVAKANYAALWAYAQGFLTTDQVANPGLYRSVDANTFALPILDGLFIRSLGGAAAALGVKQADEFKSHTHADAGHSHRQTANDGVADHQITASGPSTGNSYATATQAGASIRTRTDFASLNPTGGAETRPANVALVPCVKALNTLLLPSQTLPKPAVELIAEKVASASATLDFTNITGFPVYRFVFQNLVPSGNTLQFRCSVDNGATFDAGAAIYHSGLSGVASAAPGTALLRASAPADAGLFYDSFHTSPGYGMCGDLRCFTMGSSALAKQFKSDFSFLHSNGHIARLSGAHLYNNQTQAANAVRFYCNGTLSGRVTLYGERGAS